MIKSLRKIGYKLAGENPAVPPDTPSGTAVLRVDIRWERGRGRKEGELETRTFGDGIII